MSEELHQFFQRIGKRRGKAGGPAAAAKLTPEQRRERARKAALASWDKLRD